MKPKYSFIVGLFPPYYHLFERCLKSISSQTYNDFECLLLIYDKSLNLDSFKLDSRFKIVFTPSEDLDIKKNIGIEKSLGEYLIFIDCDDYISSRYLEIANFCFNKYDVDVLCFNKTSNEIEFNQDFNFDFSKILSLNSSQIKEMAFSRFVRSKETSLVYKFPLDNTVAKVYKNTFLKQFNIKYPEHLIRGDDSFFSNKVYLRCNSLAILDDFYCYFHYKHSESISKNFDSSFYDINSYVETTLMLFDGMLETYNGLNDYLKKVVGWQTREIAKAYLKKEIKMKKFKTMFLKTFPDKHCQSSIIFKNHNNLIEFSYFKRNFFLFYLMVIIRKNWFL